MKLKNRQTENVFSNLIRTISPRMRIMLFLLMGIILVTLAFFSGALMHRTGLLTKPSMFRRAFLKDPLSISANYIRGRFANPERIYIDINYENFQRLAYWRSLALEKETLYGVDQNYINAQIRYRKDTIPARIRLKGGLARHHLGEKKWSLRVQIRGDKTLFGMKAFALMDPQRRNFMLEWFIRQVMREEGIISKRYKFIEVVINGENKGIYAVDESYDKIMIEDNQRREAPVIRLVQDPLWFEEASWHLPDSQSDDYYFSADVDAFDLKKITSDPVTFKQFQKAVNLYKAFRRGDLAVGDVFDVDRFAKWMAVGDITGAWHGFSAYNMRFYYNPITSKLEPAPDDCFNETSTDPGDRIFRLNDQYMKGAFLKQVFSDLGFTERYIQELERVSKKAYLDNIFNALRKEITENLDILHKDYLIYEFPREQLYKNQEDIREILNPYKGITAYFEEERPNSIVLSIASVKTIPVEIINLTYKEGTVLKPKDRRIILRGKDYAKPLIFNKVEFVFPDGFSGIESPSELKVNYNLLGTSTLRSESVFTWPSYRPGLFANDFIRKQPNFKDFHFISVDPSSNEISLKQGHWILNRSLVIPEGYVFVLTPGTNLDLTNTATILSYSPIRFIGSDDSPIIISSSDSSGQGIAVLNASEKSFLENVIFKNLSEPSQNGRNLTGPITFYESAVNVNKCRFLGNKSEDTLNIIRTRFIINNSFFEDSASDAVDVDFGEGLVLNTSFVNCGNDAMDFSGSVVTVSKSFINGAGDKGISVGENSYITVKQVEIRNGKIGVASKDFSEVSVEDIQIYNSQIGLALYQKKPEFGPANMSAQRVSFIDVARKHLIEEGSVLVLDGKRLPGTQRDVAKEIY